MVNASILYEEDDSEEEPRSSSDSLSLSSIDTQVCSFEFFS